ncbi:MAG: dinitrogenase iron-molybdenum cofactor biosynthesis protein [Actinobacteria bacterium HGW-Actinobacteria-6]|nr:MAG: dinitrogenase iron-molybdenum cofactor biosynthesis protein [Actinobacteria bacterium HGW-Actinobacteria-6]
MKVVVSALGPGLDDRVDERFGRAMYLIVTDTDNDSLESIENATNRNALQGAGIASAEIVSDQGAKTVITGHLGPKAFAALGVAGVRGYNGAGMTVREAIAAFVAGSLEELTEAGEAHAG